MAKKAKEAALPTRENLEALAGEVNTVLNCDPAIKFTKKTTDVELVEMIKTEVKDGVYEIDFTEDEQDKSIPVFSEESRADFAAIGIEVLPGSPDDGDESVEDGEEVIEEEIQEELPLEDEVEPEPVATKAKGKPAKTKEVPVKAPEKPAKAKTPPAKATTKATPEKAVKTAEKFTRNNALVAALLLTTKTPMTKQEICELSDSIYVEHGGASGAFVSEVIFRYGVPCLVELGVVEKTDDKKFRLLP